MNRIIRYCSLLLLTGIIFTGCRTGRQASETGRHDAVTDVRTMFDSITADYNEWLGLKIPFSARVDGLKVSVSGTAYIYRDETIYMSARFLGMEVGTLKITPDLITVVDKVHQVYMSEPVKALTDKLPLTLGNIQDMLLGHCFVPGDKAADGSREFRRTMTLSGDPASWTATPRHKVHGVDFKFSFGGTALENMTATAAGKTLEVTYSDPAAAGTNPLAVFASVVKLSIPGDRKDLSGEIKWNLRKAEQTNVIPNISYPTVYRQVDAAQFVKYLSKF